jgi:hypothetical protein
MALPAAPGIIKVEVVQDVAGYECINVMHGNSNTGGVVDAASLLVLAEAAFASWSTHFGPINCTVWSLQRIVLTDLSAIDAPQAESGEIVHGAVVGGISDASRSLVVTLKTAVRTRSGRGRAYIAGRTDEAVATVATWDLDAVLSTQNALAGFWDDMRTANAGETLLSMSPVVLSYFSGVDSAGRPIPRAEPIAYDVIGFEGRVPFGTQRRRLRN